VWQHELFGNLISGSLAILHLYGKDDDFGPKDERSSLRLGHRKIKMWQIGFSSMAMARIYNPEDMTIDLLKAAQLESVMERNRRSRDQGIVCEELGDATIQNILLSMIMVPRISKDCYKRDYTRN
jgi:hypothetical protein